MPLTQPFECGPAVVAVRRDLIVAAVDIDRKHLAKVLLLYKGLNSRFVELPRPIGHVSPRALIHLCILRRTNVRHV